MGRADFLLLGDWNVQCFQCGFKRKSSMMERNWQGYWVCPEHNEPRQTQDFVRGVPDNQLPPWVQPWPGVVYSYSNSVIGFGDGINLFFQLGSGLYNVTVTQVQVGGSITTNYTDNGKGGITLNSPPSLYTVVSASGSETMA